VAKLVFLDADDTFLTPPYEAIRKASQLMGITQMPSEDEFINRTDIEFYKAFPLVFASKNKMWLRVLAALPFGFFASYKLHAEIDRNELACLLEKGQVIVLSKNPPSFAKARLQRILELTGVDIKERYIACGPIFKKSTPKIDIIKEIAIQRKIALKDCLLVDDSMENIMEAAKEGVQGLLIDAPWNRLDTLATDHPTVSRIERAHFTGAVMASLKTGLGAEALKKTIYIIPDKKHHHAVRERLRSNRNAECICLEKKSAFNVLRVGPYNFSIDAFKRLTERPDFLDLEIILCDKNGFEHVLSPDKIKTFLPLQPELRLAAAIKMRAFCRDLLEANGNRFELPAFFNLYYRPRRDIVADLKGDVIIKNVLVNFMKTESKTQTEAMETLDRHINSIVYTRSYRGCKFGYHIVDFVVKRLIRKMNVRFPEGLRKTEDECFTVFAPIHRSYLDSGILVVELAKSRQQFPYIVAADKMLYVWLGRVGSFMGAFFVARQQVDSIYSSVMMCYLKQIHREAGCIEVFIEGARSRSGLTLPPKKGIINSIDHNRKLLPNLKVAIVPVAFVYNKLPESEILLSEVYEERRKEGKVSLKEQADFLIRSREMKSLYERFRGFKRRYTSKSVSDCYIEFGEPVFLGSKTCLISTRSSSTKDASVQDSLNEVMYRINRITPILPSSLITLAILASKDHHVTSDKVMQFLSLSHRLISLYGLPKGTLFDVSKNEEHLEQALKLPFINRKFKRVAIDERWLLSITELDSTRAAHYRNNILHYLVLPSTLANILTYSTKPVKREELHRYLDHLFHELSIKYFLPITGDVNKLINDTIQIFCDFGFITQHGDSYLFNGETDSNAPFVMLSGLAEDFAKNDLNYAFARFRRTFPRLEMEISATLKQDNTDYMVTIRNLSAGGALVTLDVNTLEKGLEVRLSIPYEGKKFLFKGKISRSEEFCAGIQFVEIDETQSNILVMIIGYYSSQLSTEPDLIEGAQQNSMERTGSLPR